MLNEVVTKNGYIFASYKINNYIVKFPVGKNPIIVTFNFHSSHISYVQVLEVNRFFAVRKRNSKILLLDSRLTLLRSSEFGNTTMPVAG